ncbi:MAG: hypothetical protein IJB19_02660 [Clostridia bacterium]|nr:hypothetical protein [Clostridia bacterium]
MAKAESKETVGKRLRVTDLIPRICCVFFALVIWLYAMSSDSPDYESTFSGVTVSVENAAVLSAEKNLSVISGYGNLADITITGKKSDVISYSLEDIVASVDVSGITEPGRHHLSVSVTTPEGCMLKNVYPTSIEVYVDEISTKTIPVKVNVTSVQYDQSITLGALTPDVSAVTISGPASVIDAAQTAIVELDLGTVTTSLSARGELKVVTESGIAIDNPYLTISQSSVGVTIPVYVERDLPITVDTKYGYLNAENAEITVVPKTITVRADPKLLTDVDSLTVATLDETKLTDNSTTRIVSITLPDGVENVSGTKTASISIKHKGTVKKSVSVSQIELKNPNDLEYTLIADSINITLRAPSDIAEMLFPEDFTLVGELNYTGVRGIVQVPLTVEVPAEYADSVYALGEYTAMVNIEQ